MANQKKPEWPKLRYGDGECARCRELDKLKLKPKPDDLDYIYEDDDFEGDEELMLRVIHYRRKCEVTGRFDVDCPPPTSHCASIYPREHYSMCVRDYEKRLKMSVKFAIDTYNQHKGQNLILLGILNVCIQPASRYYIFYVTFEGFNESDEKSARKSYVETYQTVVSCACWMFGKYEVCTFRKCSNSTGRGVSPFVDEDLLPPNSYYEESTRVKKELMWTLA
ncbi:unnamed protein product [Linum trigynum]|uniref:Uncharacterized protein n=1 Tax=Linum trigynum TaxID=586398 RepID=A0AAV2F4T7_9ROSI